MTILTPYTKGLTLNIEIIGPYPPPYGGIANHIARLVPYLEENNIAFTIHNHGNYSDNSNIIANNKSLFWYIRYLFKRSDNIIHFHQTMCGLHYLYWFLFSLINKNQILVTLHNENILKQNTFLKSLNLWLLKKSKRLTVICVSEKVNTCLLKNNIKSQYIPAYIPPNNIIQKRENFDTYNIFCNAWKIVDKSYIEKYGFDLIFELISAHKDKKIKLYIFIGSDINVQLLKTIITEKDICNKVEIIINQNLVEHFYYADLLIRANRDDAYGVSIQEAHDCGVPTISSDVCTRPEGTHLFTNSSFPSLLKKFQKIYNTKKTVLLKNTKKTSYHIELINIYKELIKEQNETVDSKL